MNWRLTEDETKADDLGLALGLAAGYVRGALHRRRHALVGAGWPPNGLTSDENRELFVSDDSLRVARLSNPTAPSTT